MASSSSPASPCPICLESINDDAYMDSCFHSFCYKCISQWVTYVASRTSSRPLSSIKCPLCKTENLSIIHGFDGKSFFERDYVNQDNSKRRVLSMHELRFQQVYNGGEVTSCTTADVLQYWKRRKYLQKNTWLKTWLKREIQALMQDENVDVIVYHIDGVIESFMKSQEKEAPKGTPEKMREEFRDLLSNVARPFLLGRTQQFVNEVEMFLVLRLNIDAYDKVRMQQLRTSTFNETREHHVQSSNSSLEDQFVYFLSEDMNFTDEK